MDLNQTFLILKKPLFWLSVLLFVFIIKGVILSILFPFFQGPDEQIHYATIQHLAEPTEKSWPIIKSEKRAAIGSDISTFRFSEETIRGAQATQFDEVKFQNENTQEFSRSALGLNENEIIKNNWKRYVDVYPSNTSGTVSIYYFLGTKIEQALVHQSILTRLFSIRVLSVILGAFVVWLAYLTSRKVGLSEHQSLIVATLVVFQPMFSASASQVNIDIALILAFSVYIYISVWMLRDGMNWKNLVLLPLSLILAFYSKGPGVILFALTPFIIGFLIYKRFDISPKKFIMGTIVSIFVIAALIFLFVPKSYLIGITNFSAASQFDSPIESLTKYADKTLGTGALFRTETSYWGHFGWLDTKVSDVAIDIIWTIEVMALLGVILYLVSKRMVSYLPEKKYVIFFIGIILALQLAIRFYDWRVFDATGQILIGTPGRYFLPNIIPHILLIVTGLGFFTQNKKQFDILLKILLVLMILFSLYTMINVILPRYYL